MITQHNTQGTVFLRLYVNNYHCNETCLGPCFSATIYLTQKHTAHNTFLLASLVLKLSQDVCLGKGPNGTCTALKCGVFLFSFFFLNLFSAANWKVHNALLQLMRWILSCPFQCLSLEAFSILSTLIKRCCTKLWMTETVFWVPEWNFLLQRQQMPALFIISYHFLRFHFNVLATPIL